MKPTYTQEAWSNPAPAIAAARTESMPAPVRILVLTAGYGEGHNAAARALASAVDRASRPGTARVVDLFACASPTLNAVGRRLYVSMINRAPTTWRRLYAWIDASPALQRQLRHLRRERACLEALIEQERPAALACTYPVYAFIADEIARRGGWVPPLYNVVTDSISINSLWWARPCRGWFLPNEDSAKVLRRAGVDDDAIHVSGFPVPALFDERPADLTPPDFGAGATPRVLHIINTGTRHAAETARRLLTETDWDVTCAVGRDRRLREHLSRIAANRRAPTEILGWTDQIPSLLMTRHVVVSKAGGATTQEAIAARCPMVISQVVPGQEEGNCELILRHRAGARAETPDAILRCLYRAFADRGRICQEWRESLRTIAPAGAAQRIAMHLLDAARTPPAPTAARNPLPANRPVAP